MLVLSAVVAVVGLLLGSLVNRLVVREPGYVITDPADLPEGADESMLDELAELEELPPVPVVAVLRPRTWARRWYPVVEVLVAAGLVLTVHRFGSLSGRVTVGFLVIALVALAAVDFRVFRLPNRINFPAIGVGLALMVVTSLDRDAPGALVGMTAGGLFYAGMLFLAHVVYPRGMGWGDVKLAWLMGFYLGWLGWQSGSLLTQVFYAVEFVLYAAVIGSLAGVLVGVPYAVVRRSAKAAFPYGPSLALGCLAVVFYGQELTGR